MTGKASGLMERAQLRMERLLRDRGYTQPEVRRLVVVQVVLAIVTSAVMLAASALGRLGWSYAAGALLATLNFAALARFVQHLVYVQRGAVTALLFRFYGRMLFTGLVLFGLIYSAKASLPGLLAGLSTVVVTGVYWGLSRNAGNNVKEA